jgi:TRAP-type C4-dicarboxylate transport system permease small subunit
LEKKESYEVNYWVRERGSLMKVIIKRIASLFNSIGFVLGVTLMILMIFTLSAAVCARYVFNRPIFWTDEFGAFSLEQHWVLGKVPLSIT